ncbi:hypothetical protein SAMN02745249_01350 [Atopostipes suicloacalis DSM 15692]|uniref:Uncharacterized protein n=1 Tax=Atopostipes suicloacalis DSM 15692 TaxID=1121025 RepID=A0A1M4X5C3_9LACT|nr:hypothetical protein [Atopostipes suicloacalis]SHE88635.1 hypothetical protein SAMN02745249_01350 [Atopostipes suicloacalis DSM 15692]
MINKMVSYIKNNLSVLIIILYSTIISTQQGQLALKYGEKRFYFYFVLGGLLLILLMKGIQMLYQRDKNSKTDD